MNAVIARLRRHAAALAIAGWFVATTAVAAGMLARHLVALPPVDPGGPASALAIALRGPGTGGWLAVHVLSTECACSVRIARHLVESSRPGGWSEIVVWVGDAPAPVELPGSRFRVQHASSAQLAAAGIEGVPLLIVVAPDDRVLYAGGYTTRKQGPDVRDLDILASSRAASAPSPLPVFGCAISQRLREALAALPTP